MAEEHFDELKDWSARKHALLHAYLDGFVRITGSRDPYVYYVDGFAGPGLYVDGNKGSPILAAEYAQSLAGKTYALRCINVEEDPDNFASLTANTVNYAPVVTNLPGAFGDQVDQILGMVKQQPAIFFLDPFGLKGIEWRYLSRVGQRSSITEILMRVNPSDLQRLAGFWNSADPGAAAKCQLLTDYFGFSSRDEWLKVWLSDGVEGLINLYMTRLRQLFKFAYRCAIRSINGSLKYYLLFATHHAKGAVLMNDTVYLRESDYQRDVQEFKENQATLGGQARQLGFFGKIDPTPEEIEADKVRVLKLDLQKRFAGKTLSRQSMRAALLDEHFGRYNKPHFTRALSELKNEGVIVVLSGPASEDETSATFKP